MSDKNLELLKQANEAQQKYDYFFSGLTIALFAFIGKNFTATSLGLNTSTFELGALICLLISIFSGLLRFENAVTIKTNNFQHMDNLELKKELTRNLHQKDTIPNSQTDRCFDYDLARYTVDCINTSNPKIEKSDPPPIL